MCRATVTLVVAALVTIRIPYHPCAQIETKENDKFIDAVDKFFRQMTDLDTVYPRAKTAKQAVAVVRTVLSLRVKFIVKELMKSIEGAQVL